MFRWGFGAGCGVMRLARLWGSSPIGRLAFPSTALLQRICDELRPCVVHASLGAFGGDGSDCCAGGAAKAKTDVISSRRLGKLGRSKRRPYRG